MTGDKYALSKFEIHYESSMHLNYELWMYLIRSSIFSNVDMT